MKIYTKTGDLGETGLLGGLRVSKSSLVIEVTGLLDETNCLLGVAISNNGSQPTVPAEVVQAVTKIQHDLFDLGSRVSACLSDTNRAAEFTPGQVEQLEAWIDDFDGRLPGLQAFILPGGSWAGSVIHQARAVCRRTERALVALVQADLNWPEKPAPDRRLVNELIYLNRLSDLLFVFARYINLKSDSPEVQWQPTGGKSNS